MEFACGLPSTSRELLDVARLEEVRDLHKGLRGQLVEQSLAILEEANPVLHLLAHTCAGLRLLQGGLSVPVEELDGLALLLEEDDLSPGHLAAPVLLGRIGLEELALLQMDARADTDTVCECANLTSHLAYAHWGIGW